MSLVEDAARLESILPLAITALFWSSDGDPLSQHSVGQIRLMRALFGGTRTATELSMTLGLSPSSLTQMANRMIQAGLVDKELDPQDRRVRKLSLTPEGRILMENRKSSRAQAGVRLLEKLDPEKRYMLIAILTEIVQISADRGGMLSEAPV